LPSSRRGLGYLLRVAHTMSPIPPFPAGTLPISRIDGSETRLWLGPATISHAERQKRTWSALLEAQCAMDRAWNWRVETEAAHEDRSRLVLAACERAKSGRLHALMNVLYLPRASRISPSGDLLYIDMLAVAPWNRPGHPTREIRGLGPLLIQAAILVSREAGLGGAFGLHSLPDPKTIQFYTNVVGMSPIGMESTPEGKLLYFETSARRAEAFLGREEAV
jgi:hypothetical protein